jgi:subtilisin family serine protease
MVGIAPDSRVLALEACWYEDAQATHAVCNSFSLARALGSALALDVDIINMSLSGPEDPLLRRLIERALKQNILVIAASGNEVAGNFPASIDGVIAVASDEHWADQRQRSYLMLAPGADILSTTVDHGYDFFSGNSIATAQVSGVLALVKQKYKKQETGKLLRYSNSNSAATVANVCELLQAIMSDTATSICPYFPHTASINVDD